MLKVFSKGPKSKSLKLCVPYDRLLQLSLHICSEKEAADIIKMDGHSCVLTELFFFQKEIANRICLACEPQCAKPSSRSNARHTGNSQIDVG